MTKEKVYLGGSVYAEIFSGNLTLTTENGIRASNIIILEPDVLDALLKYLGMGEREGVLKENKL